MEHSDHANVNPNSESIDFSDFKFLSDDHTRFEFGIPTNANNKGAWRGIGIRTTDNVTFHVTIYNMNGDHPVWGNNIQMAQKPMRIIQENEKQIVLRGFGMDPMGESYADFGLTIQKMNQEVAAIFLHMYDRSVDIEYKKAGTEAQSAIKEELSDFENFKSFTFRWNRDMSIVDKMKIAMQSDELNNSGADAYENGDLHQAVLYFEKALGVMPNNDDALKNLKLCYSKTGNKTKVNEVVRKLDFLDSLQ